MIPEERSSLGRMPDFFIVGAPKCGTTAMYSYLRQHPQVFMPFHKEPLFFGGDLTRRYGRLTSAEYAALFAEARQDQRVGEASAWYLYSTSAAREIKSASPDARIIVMLRNPVDVMHAQHSQLLFNHQEDVASFESALALEEERAAGRCLPAGPIRPENLLYRRIVQFSDQLRRYFDTFGRNRVHIVIYDDVATDTLRVYGAVLRFLGVDPDFTPDLSPVNENRRERSRFLQRLIWNPPGYRWLVPALRRHPLAHQVRSRLLALNSRRQRREPLNAGLRARLTAELAPEVESLSELIGRDLSGWSRQAIQG